MKCMMNLRCFWNACHVAPHTFTVDLFLNTQLEHFVPHKPSRHPVSPSIACSTLAQIPDVEYCKLQCFHSVHTVSCSYRNIMVSLQRLVFHYFSITISQHVSNLQGFVGDKSKQVPSHFVFHKWQNYM